MLPCTAKSWISIGAFVIAALFAQHHDGTEPMPALVAALVVAAMVALLWAFFLAGKSRERAARAGSSVVVPPVAHRRLGGRWGSGRTVKACGLGCRAS